MYFLSCGLDKEKKKKTWQQDLGDVECVNPKPNTKQADAQSFVDIFWDNAHNLAFCQHALSGSFLHVWRSHPGLLLSLLHCFTSHQSASQAKGLISGVGVVGENVLHCFESLQLKSSKKENLSKHTFVYRLYIYFFISDCLLYLWNGYRRTDSSRSYFYTQRQTLLFHHFRSGIRPPIKGHHTKSLTMTEATSEWLLTVRVSKQHRLWKRRKENSKCGIYVECWR